MSCKINYRSHDPIKYFAKNKTTPKLTKPFFVTFAGFFVDLVGFFFVGLLGSFVGACLIGCFFFRRDLLVGLLSYS